MTDSTTADESNETAAAPVLGYVRPSDVSVSAVVWCRLLALFMVGWGIQSALVGSVQAIDYFRRFPFSVAIMVAVFFGSLVPALVWLGLAWYCWANAASLADRMMHGREENLSPRGMSADELLLTVIIGIGIYLIATGLPTLGQLVYTVLERARYRGGPANVFDGAIVGSSIRLILGLWLILGPRGIVKMVRRHAGRWRDDAEPKIWTEPAAKG